MRNKQTKPPAKEILMNKPLQHESIAVRSFEYRVNAIADIMAAITLRRLAKTQPEKQATPEISGVAEANKNEQSKEN